MAEVFASRRQKLRQSLKKLDANGVLITNPINVRYLTGFTGDSTFLLLIDKREVLISDTRYETQISEECPGLGAEIRDASTSTEQLAVQVIRRLKPRSLAIEAESLTKATYEILADGLKSVSLFDSVGLVSTLRSIKDKTEIESIRSSIKVAQRAYQICCAQLRTGQTEREVAFELENQVRRFGGEGCSFDPIVAVGALAALPHGRPGNDEIGSAPFVLIDWGAMVWGYASDLTRVVVTGKISTKYRRIYQVVLRAQQAGIERIRPGAEFRAVDSAARSVIAAAGFGKYFGHGLGHGFGLEIHEPPRLAPSSSGVLQPGMVVTVEPGIYLPGWGGIRIEDDVLVTPDGYEILTSVPRDLESQQIDCG